MRRKIQYTIGCAVVPVRLARWLRPVHLAMAGVFVGAILTGCGGAQGQAVRVDPALLSLVPADTTMLAGLKLEALRGTAVWKRYVAGQPFSALDDLASETGLDLRTGAWEALVVSNGKTTEVMARGDFAPQGLEPRPNRPGVTRTPYRGYTLIGDERGVVAFMNPSTAVAGPPSAVRAVIDQRGKSGPPPALRELLRQIPKEDQIWIATTGGFPALPDSGNAANLRRIASMVDSVVAGADLRSGLAAFATAACPGEIGAASLDAALRGFLVLGRLGTSSKQPELLRVFDGIKIEQRQNTVRVSVSISENVLEAAAEKWGREAR
ncbi:MAG: hypothetical protein ABSG25_14080 [Bryobacteraceae bacterium]